MNNIDKLALREAADSVIQKYGSEWFETGRQLCTVNKSKIELIAAANPATVLALLDELEAVGQELLALKQHVAERAEWEQKQVIKRAAGIGVKGGVSYVGINYLDAWRLQRQ